jgi:hypothetical protein
LSIQETRQLFALDRGILKQRLHCFAWHLGHGCPTCGPPGCVMWPLATFVNDTHTHTIKITQWFRSLGIPLTVTFIVKPMNQLAIMVVAFCKRKLDTLVLGKHLEHRNERTGNI